MRLLFRMKTILWLGRGWGHSTLPLKVKLSVPNKTMNLSDKNFKVLYLEIVYFFESLSLLPKIANMRFPTYSTMRIITSMSNLELAENIVDNFGTHLTSSRIPQRRKFPYYILFLLYCHKQTHFSRYVS